MILPLLFILAQVKEHSRLWSRCRAVQREDLRVHSGPLYLRRASVK